MGHRSASSYEAPRGFPRNQLPQGRMDQGGFILNASVLASRAEQIVIQIQGGSRHAHGFALVS
jgi:hypothetical protein